MGQNELNLHILALDQYRTECSGRLMFATIGKSVELKGLSTMLTVTATRDVLSGDVSDLLPLRRNRRVSVYPLTLADMYHADIQKILDSDKCEEASLQMVRPSADMKTWAGQVLRFYL